jgi:DNA-binding NarL/FixJ family response regulator
MDYPPEVEWRRDPRLPVPPSPILSVASALIYAAYPIWLDSMGRVAAGAGLGRVHLTTDLSGVLGRIEELHADVVVLAAPAEQFGEILAIVRRARARHPELRIIVLAPADTREAIDAAFDAGATAYARPTANPGDIAAAIRQSFEQSIYFGRAESPSGNEPEEALAPSAIGPEVRRLPRTLTVRAERAPADLTRRELEILRLVASGRSNSELARLLWVTEQTIKFHLSNIYRKLGVANRTEAAHWARVHGLLTPDGESDEELSTPGVVAR